MRRRRGAGNGDGEDNDDDDNSDGNGGMTMTHATTTDVPSDVIPAQAGFSTDERLVIHGRCFPLSPDSTRKAKVHGFPPARE
jgi:hypothetical protein